MPYWVLRYGDQPEIAPYRRGFEAVLRKLPSDTRWVVACHEEVVAPMGKWLQRLDGTGESRIVSIPDDLKFTVWAQDACLVQARPEGGVRLLTPTIFPRMDDASVLAAVSAEVGLPTVPTDLAFQGGNVLIGDDFWLLGADAVLQTLRTGSHHDEMEAIRAFAETFDARRRLIVVGTDLEVPASTSRETLEPGTSDGRRWEEAIHTGSREGTRQPLFDLDTFLSLAGRGPDDRYRLLVGDPRLAAEISGTSLPDHVLPELFDDVATQLAAMGFQIHRNPLPLVHHDDPVQRRRRWYFASANNVLTEIEGKVRRVWLPTYGDDEHPELRAVDERNAAIWRRLGFDVDLLPSFHVFARGLGAVRCICKCLGHR